jgi:hypothetical protein
MDFKHTLCTTHRLGGVKPTIIANGAKNMYIEVPGCRVRMVDSINVLPSALSELPKMFGLEELKKGEN